MDAKVNSRSELGDMAASTALFFCPKFLLILKFPPHEITRGVSSDGRISIHDSHQSQGRADLDQTTGLAQV